MKQKIRNGTKKGRKLLTFLLTVAMVAGLIPGMAVTAMATILVDASTDYTITIPATLTVENSGWNATTGITTSVKNSETFDAGKMLTVTASSANDWALKSGDNTVGYNLADSGDDTSTYSSTAEPASWEFNATELNADGGTNKTMGIIVEDYSEKPEGTYEDTVTFTASVGDVATGKITARRAAYEGTGAPATSWNEGDQVSVFPEAWSRTALGMLTAAASDNGSTTLTGDLTTLPSAGDNLKLLFPRAKWDYTGQKGSLQDGDDAIQKKFNYALADVTVDEVIGNTITTTNDASFSNQQAIVKFTLQDSDGNALKATSLTISAASNKLVTGKGFNTISRHSGYTYDNGSAAADATSNLVDGNTGTKWCSNTGHKTDGIYFCEFHTASAVQVDGYTLTTGTDNEAWNGRNPKDWVLKAKVNSGDAWTTIATVTNDATMEDKNTTPYDFDVDTPGEYQYFRIEISSTRGGDGTMQLGEMQLFAKNYGTAYGSLTITPASATSEMTVALRNEKGSADTYSLAANVSGTTYSYSQSGLNFENGKYYTVTVKMNNAPQYANDAIEVFQRSRPRIDDYLMGDSSYTHITLDQAYALAKYLGTTTGNTVAVVYDNNMIRANYALSTDASATAHQDFGDMLFDLYNYHVYLVP